MKKRKICIFTGSRADFGLLKRFIGLITKDSSLKLQIVVGGSHFLKRHGFTYKEIIKNGFKIDKKIKVDNVVVKKITNHIGFLPTIYSTPDSILYQGKSNSERQKNINQTNCLLTKK